jgi:tRNA pseudouridine55 synthase
LRRTAIGPWADPPPGAQPLINGAQLFPWLPARELSPDELRKLQNREPIPLGSPAPPQWPLPAGFEPPPHLRAMHQGALHAMLLPEGPLLRAAPLLKSPL